jgi:hypothetical protein
MWLMAVSIWARSQKSSWNPKHRSMMILGIPENWSAEGKFANSSFEVRAVKLGIKSVGEMSRAGHRRDERLQVDFAE